MNVGGGELDVEHERSGPLRRTCRDGGSQAAPRRPGGRLLLPSERQQDAREHGPLNRAELDAMPRGPTASASLASTRPTVSMPWAIRPSKPAARAAWSSWWMSLMSRDAAA